MSGCLHNSVWEKSKRLWTRSPQPQLLPEISAFSDKTQSLEVQRPGPVFHNAGILISWRVLGLDATKHLLCVLQRLPKNFLHLYSGSQAWWGMPYALCPMPYALCPMHVGYLMLLIKAIYLLFVLLPWGPGALLACGKLSIVDREQSNIGDRDLSPPSFFF